MLKQNIVSSNAVSIFEEQIGLLKTITFQSALYLFILNKALETGEIGWEEGKQVIQTLYDHYPKLDEKKASLVVIRKMGVVTVLLLGKANEFFVDEKTKIAVLLHVENAMEELLNELVIGGV